ncbi:uncharacterized protein ACO6RY_19365 [Pungitius sinensis]
MAGRADGRATDARLPEHWRDVREWSMEKRQSHRMWVADVEAVLRSMERQLNASQEKSSYKRSLPGVMSSISFEPQQVSLPPTS